MFLKRMERKNGVGKQKVSKWEGNFAEMVGCLKKEGGYDPTMNYGSIKTMIKYQLSMMN